MSFTIDVLAIAEKRKLDSQSQNQRVQDPDIEFLSVLKSHNFNVDHVEITNKVKRVKANDSKDECCWYTFDVIGGVGFGHFGDWRNGVPETFISTNYKVMSVEERRTIDKTAQIAKEERLKQEIEAQEQAKNKAQVLLASSSSDIKEHAYLEKKGVNAYGLKTDGNKLYIPIVVEDQICSYQEIYKDGRKRFLKDGKIEGGYHYIKGEVPKTYFVEGYATGATIHMATKANVVVCFNASNLPKVLGYFRKYIDDPIIIAADNDHEKEAQGKGNAGLKYAKQCVEDYPNVSMIHPDIEVGITDFNDLSSKHGLQSVKAKTGSRQNRMNIIQVDQMDAIPEKWFIKKILPQKKVGLIFGRSGHMKSFVTIDMALHLATGRDWHGHRVNETHNILYVCGEGASGIRNRVIAWKEHHQINKAVPFYMTSSPVLLLEREETNLMLEALQDFMLDSNIKKYPSLIIIDTLNRNFGDGDENSTKDMTTFVNVLEELHRITGSMFLIVHHSSKGNEETARGNASLRNSCDVEYKVEKTNEQMEREGFEKAKIMVTNTKMKDYGIPEPVYFEPKTIVLGKDEDGDDISSVVMVKMQGDLAKRETEIINRPVASAKSETEKAKICFQNAMITIGQHDVRERGIFSMCAPLQKKRVDTEFKGACLAAGIKDASMRKAKSRAILELSAENIMTTNDKSNEYTVTSKVVLDKINGAANHD